MSPADLVLVERRGAIAIVTLNRPAQRNAWSYPMHVAYFKALTCDGDPSVRVVVVTGAGNAFCVGGDPDELEGYRADGSLHLDVIDRTDHLAPTRLAKPVIAAINGSCGGIGMVLSLMCDLSFTVPGAKFSTAFSRRGLAADQGITWLLPRVVGVRVAMDLLLSARVFDGREARELGVVNRLVPDGEALDAAIDYAQELVAKCSPAAMATIKRQVWDDLERDFVGSVRAADELADRHIGHPDFTEGLHSWIERRPPRFNPLPPPD